MTEKTIILRINFRCLESVEAASVRDLLEKNMARYGEAKVLSEPKKYWKNPEQFQVLFEIALNNNWVFQTMSLDLTHEWEMLSSQEAIWSFENEKNQYFIDNRVTWVHIEEI
jgi:hypothetical protein